MEYLNTKNKKIRCFAKKKEKKTFIYRTIQNNFNFGELLKLKAYSLIITSLIEPFHKTAFIRRCILTKRKKRINSIINVSRLMFLNFVRSGELCGARKAVW